MAGPLIKERDILKQTAAAYFVMKPTCPTKSISFASQGGSSGAQIWITARCQIFASTATRHPRVFP